MSVSNANPIRIESYKEKAIRKFKEQPLVPIGTVATTVALIIAMTKMRRGQSQSLNHWLRIRVIAQGLTIVAVVAGSYAYGQTKSQKEAQAAQEEQERILIAAREKREFEERLKSAEEAHDAEMRLMQAKASSAWGWGWEKEKQNAEHSVPHMGTHPAASAVVETQSPGTSAVPSATPSSSSNGGWSWFGWRNSSNTPGSSTSSDANKKS